MENRHPKRKGYFAKPNTVWMSWLWSLPEKFSSLTPLTGTFCSPATVPIKVALPKREILKQKLFAGFSYAGWEQVSLPIAIKRSKVDFIHCTANTAPLVCPVPMILTLHDVIYLEEVNFKGSAYQKLWKYLPEAGGAWRCKKS